MCPGLSGDPVRVDYSRKTATIDRELKSRNTVIAALQKTLLPSNGSLREQDYTFFVAGKEARGTTTRWRWICSEKLSTVFSRTSVQRFSPHPFNLLRSSEYPERLGSHALLIYRYQLIIRYYERLYDNIRLLVPTWRFSTP